MKKLLVLIITIYALASNAATVKAPSGLEEFVGQLDAFIYKYNQTLPQDDIFKDMLSWQLSLPAEKAQRKTQIQQILDNYELNYDAMMVVSTVKTFHNVKFNKAVDYTIERYFVDEENRRAIALMIEVMTMSFADPHFQAENKKRKESFLPHFIQGASEEPVWVAAAAWTLVGGRGIFGQKIANFSKKANYGMRLGYRMSQSALGHGRNLAWSALGSFVRFPLWTIKKIVSANGRIRPWVKEMSALTTFAAVSGGAYGGISSMLYKKGVFDKKSAKDELAKDVLGIAVVKAQCEVDVFKKRVAAEKYVDLADVRTQELVDAHRKQASAIAQGMATLIDLAPVYFITQEYISDVIKNNNGTITYMGQSFECPSLKGHSLSKVRVNLLRARNEFVDTLKDLESKINELKYGTLYEDVFQLSKDKGASLLDVLKSNELLSGHLGQVLLDDYKFEPLKYIARFKLVSDQEENQVTGDTIIELDHSFNSIDDAELQEKIVSMARNAMQTVDEASMKVYMYSLFSKLMQTKDGLGLAVMYAYALHVEMEQIKELGMGDYEETKSPLEYLFAEIYQMEIPEETQEDEEAVISQE